MVIFWKLNVFVYIHTYTDKHRKIDIYVYTISIFYFLFNIMQNNHLTPSAVFVLFKP